MAAGLANLDLITAPGFYESLAAKTAMLVDGLRKQLRSQPPGVPMAFSQVGGMFGLLLHRRSPKVTTFERGHGL